MAYKTAEIFVSAHFNTFRLNSKSFKQLAVDAAEEFAKQEVSKAKKAIEPTLKALRDEVEQKEKSFRELKMQCKGLAFYIESSISLKQMLLRDEPKLLNEIMKLAE